MKKLILFALLFSIHMASICQQKKLRWGILSTAVFSDVIVDIIAKSDKSEVAAVASRSLEKAQKYAQAHNIRMAYGSYEELLADESIDIIYNPLPNNLHGLWTIKAIQAGKHVLCEKPLVTTLEDFDTIQKAAKEQNVIVFEAFAYLHHPQTFKLLELLKSNRIGKVHSINSWLSINLPQRFNLADNDPNHIRLRPELAGGTLWDLGAYCSSLTLVVAQAGVPEEIWTTATKGTTGVDIAAACQMRFSNGIHAQFNTDFYAPYRAGMHIIGSNGVIELDAPWHPGFFDNKDATLIVIDDKGKKEEFVYKGNPYIYEVQTMEACVMKEAEPTVSLATSREFLLTLLAMHKSAELNIHISK